MVLPVLSPPSSWRWVPGRSRHWFPGHPEQAAAGWAAPVSTPQRDIMQSSLPLEYLQAVPGRMSYLSQEEIKLLELSKSNFHDKCLPRGLHVEPVLLLSLTQTALMMARSE